MIGSMTNAICRDIQDIYRTRRDFMSARIEQTNRLRALVAVSDFGYHSRMVEADRKERMESASEAIKAVADDPDGEHPYKTTDLIRATMYSIESLEEYEGGVTKSLVKLVNKLPIAPWLDHPDQRGFGPLSLALVIGECGDLTFRGYEDREMEDSEGNKSKVRFPIGYPNPAKLWKRMGCAPFEFGGKHHMPSTLARMPGKKPSAEEWIKIGYCPRRRSVAYLIGESLVKSNGADSEATIARRNAKGITAPRLVPGPYRMEYERAKARFSLADKERRPKHCDTHGKLCMVKLLLKNLWREWKRLASNQGEWLHLSLDEIHPGRTWRREDEPADRCVIYS